MTAPAPLGPDPLAEVPDRRLRLRLRRQRAVDQIHEALLEAATPARP
jgi:hypothetical protein